MFKYTLHEDTKNYLKTLLVEDAPSTAKKDSKKSKAKKDEKQAPTESPESTTNPPATPSPATNSTIVVNPPTTSLSPEEQKIKEAQQKAAEERERQFRNIQPDSGKDTPETQAYKENVARTSGGPVVKTTEGPTESGSPNYGYGFGPSGRGRGAPAPTGEPEDKTGMLSSYKDVQIPGQPEQSYLYNYHVLLGKSLPKVKELSGDEDSANVNPLAPILEPYKDLQRLKVVKAFMPGILSKIAAIGKMEGGTLIQDPSDVNKKWSRPTRNGKPIFSGSAATPTDQILELIDSQVIPNQPDYISQLQSSDPKTVQALYDTVKKKIERAENPEKYKAAGFMGKVQQHAEKLSGLGGLDPFFGEELAAKLLGGEWIEKAMQNIAPAQERGVISSMGNRSSIGM